MNSLTEFANPCKCWGVMVCVRVCWGGGSLLNYIFLIKMVRYRNYLVKIFIVSMPKFMKTCYEQLNGLNKQRWWLLCYIVLDLFYFILIFILFHFISFHFISFHFISFHFISFHFILFYCIFIFYFFIDNFCCCCLEWIKYPNSDPEPM